MTRFTSLPDILQTLRHEPLFVLELDITAVHRIGDTVVGVVGGGKFEGTRINGRVLAGGSDWQRILPDGTVRLDCRIVLEATDGELIGMSYHGVRSGSTEGLTRLSRGADVRPDEHYLRICPLLTTGSARHAWLNRIVAVGTGQRLANGPIYNVFEVL